MRATREKFIDLAADLNLNSVVGDSLIIDAISPSEYVVAIQKNSDEFLASGSKLPATVVRLEPAFCSYSDAMQWCAINIRACAINADFMSRVPSENNY